MKNLVCSKEAYENLCASLDLDTELSATCNLESHLNPFYNNDSGKLLFDENLSDKKVYEIVKDIETAIKDDSESKIKELKKKYCDSSEFSKAREFFDKNAQKIWNVYDKNLSDVPKNVLKCLGISNKPDLDFLLKNSILYFEKDGGKTTSEIIDGILKNKNLDYSIYDIHNYLSKMHKKHKCKYNIQTVKYLISCQNYDYKMLSELGIVNEVINDSFEQLKICDKIKYSFKNLKNSVKNYFSFALIKKCL